MSVIGLIEYIRTKDKQRAKRTMFSWWSIALGVGLLVLGIIGQVADKVGEL